MKKLILVGSVTSLLINMNAVFAEDLGTKYDINHNWSYTPLIVREDGGSVVKVKMFKRYLWVNSKPVQIAETNFTYLKNPKEKTDLKALSETIKKSFPGNFLTTKAISNGYAIEGHWKKINRYIKMDLTKKDDHVIIVTTFARSGLTNALMPELNELHSLLKTYEDKKIPKTSFIDYFMPEAHAAGGFNPSSLTNLFNGGNTTTGPSTNTGNTGGFSIPGVNTVITTNSNVNVSGGVDIRTSDGLNNNWNNTNTNLNNLNGNLGSFNNNVGNINTNVNTNWGNTNTQIGNANSNWSNTNQQIQQQGNAANANWSNTNQQIQQQGNAANANWANTNQQIQQQGDAANANWAKTNQVMDKQGDAANANWAESNRIAAQMMDPNHMAKVAFYTAAGAALGSITMNLALEGVSAGISYLYELFTGTKKKKLEWQDFQQAMSAWDGQLNDLVKMEQIVDEFISAFDFFSDKNMSNDYIKNLNIAMRDMRFDRDVMMEQFKNEQLSLGCRRVLYDAADELDQKLKDYDKIIQFATKNNISFSKNNDNYFCQQLKELQRKILGAESQMQDLRLAILKAENQFYDKNGDAREKREDNMDQINDNVAKTIKRRENYNKEATDNAKVAYDKERDDWIAACVEAKNSEGSRIKAAIDNRFTHFFKAKGMCSTVYDNSHSFQPRDNQAQQVFAEENKLRSDLKLAANSTVDIKLSEEQMNWLTRIHVDAYCYQFAHGDEAKVPAKCKDFPEMLYSMNLSKGYEKAKNAYKNRCEDRYLSGIKKLADK